MIRTVGHGTASQEEFTQLLRQAGIATVVDVRRFPGSRRHPQFGRDELAVWLPASDIDYEWMVGLGGRRNPLAESRHVVLRNAQFRAYADYMSSAEFAEALARLTRIASSSPTAVMCSESVWWRCHRRLLADHLVLIEDQTVEHLFHDGRLTAHPVTPGARSAGESVVYDLDSNAPEG